MIRALGISACLITKEAVYPQEVLASVNAVGFGEILVRTHCDSPHRKQELFEKARHEFIYYQDDDCIAPIQALLDQMVVMNRINCVMKGGHIVHYRNSRIALLGWGAVFPKSAIQELRHYRAHFGEDHIYMRETERIMTWFNYPQVRLELPVEDLPSASAPDRLSLQPGHADYVRVVEERCAYVDARRMA